MQPQATAAHALTSIRTGALLCALAVVFLGLAGASAPAMAAGDQIFTDLTTKATDMFYNGRTVILVLCCISLILTMAAAMSGRFPVQKMIVLFGAIVVIAFTSSIVTYFASPGTPRGVSKTWGSALAGLRLISLADG